MVATLHTGGVPTQRNVRRILRCSGFSPGSLTLDRSTHRSFAVLASPFGLGARTKLPPVRSNDLEMSVDGTRPISPDSALIFRGPSRDGPHQPASLHQSVCCVTAQQTRATRRGHVPTLSVGRGCAEHWQVGIPTFGPTKRVSETSSNVRLSAHRPQTSPSWALDSVCS